MIKQVIYNYIDPSGKKWNTTEDIKSNQFQYGVGQEVKRFSLQAPAGTFFYFGNAGIVMTNSCIFNYDGPTEDALTFSNINILKPKWFILDYEIGKKEGVE